jgi:phosphoenolpyruvate phosphomutase
MKQENGLTKTAYVPMAADLLHEGHLNIINEAKKRGQVLIGLLTDKAISEYKDIPLLNYEQRKIVMESIKGVDQVIEQKTWDYEPILRKIKPDFLVHGDDWKNGPQKDMRLKCINILSEWNGKLIEPQHTSNISSTQMRKSIKSRFINSEMRLSSFSRLLESKPILRFLEAHNGLTGIIVENTKIEDKGISKEFDGIWLSSLTLSTSMGKPDTEVVDFSSRFQTLDQILEVTHKPIIVDGDTGGRIEHFKYRVKTLERMGVSAVIVEDKKGDKRNSLFGDDVSQEQEDIETFCEKIRVGKKSQRTDIFMIIARIESLILGKGVEDAKNRALAYLSAGADGIMIHSKSKDTKEVEEFCNFYRKECPKSKPLVLVPSAYSHVTDNQLEKWGANVVIYANHLIRSSYPVMEKVAKSILVSGRAKEASDEHCIPIKEIIRLIPEDY